MADRSMDLVLKLRELFVSITELPADERARVIDACSLIVRLGATHQRRIASC